MEGSPKKESPRKEGKGAVKLSIEGEGYWDCVRLLANPKELITHLTITNTVSLMQGRVLVTSVRSRQLVI